jgi:hypothetical protein
MLFGVLTTAIGRVIEHRWCRWPAGKTRTDRLRVYVRDDKPSRKGIISDLID